jgi:hypothetical protein
MIGDSIGRYLAIEKPEHALIVKGPPGSGKTTKAVRAAEAACREGKRGLWLAPRHDMFADLIALAEVPGWWYEWQPRRLGDPETGLGATCHYAEQIATWLHRGYDGIQFCAGVCGWDYLKTGCIYHQQKGQREPMIVGQHPHAWGGHPLSFDFAIGDECPIGTFTREWVIPERYIKPFGMAKGDPLTELLGDLRELAEQDLRLEGPALLASLGGAERVAGACGTTTIPLDAETLAPTIHRAEDADRMPYFHLPALVHLLGREAKAALGGGDFPHRIIVNNHNLILLLRRRLSEKMPAHLIWLDATGEPRIYEEIFGRPVEVVEPRVRMQGRIFQIHDSANGKGSIRDEKDQPTVKAKRLRLQADRIASRYPAGTVAVVSHLKMLDQFADWPGQKLHYYAARGTNRLAECEALIVVGTPQPPLDELDKLARMIFWKRMRPFRLGAHLPWKIDWRKYEYTDADGQGREMPIGDFADDPDLHAILWQLREAEIIQAAHRARPNIRPADVWLLTNLPIEGLPPTELISVRELFGAPEGMDCYQWPALAAFADEKHSRGEPIYSSELVAALGISQDSAVRYLSALVKAGGWEWPTEPYIVPKRGRGNPAKAIVPRRTNE